MAFQLRPASCPTVRREIRFVYEASTRHVETVTALLMQVRAVVPIGRYY